jgi:hypothetical protein
MISDALKIAKLQSRDKARQAQIDFAKMLLGNPVVELLGGIAVITYLNKGSQSWLQSITGINLAAGAEYAGLVTIIGLQQIAPLMPSIAAGSEGMAKALPALLALGA